MSTRSCAISSSDCLIAEDADLPRAPPRQCRARLLGVRSRGPPAKMTPRYWRARRVGELRVDRAREPADLHVSGHGTLRGTPASDGVAAAGSAAAEMLEPTSTASAPHRRVALDVGPRLHAALGDRDDLARNAAA